MALLLAPTTACVEGGFNITNIIHDELRNRMSFSTLNFLMMLRINFEQKFMNDFITLSAIDLLKGEKKRQKLHNVINVLYKEGSSIYGRVMPPPFLPPKST
jgi:hypothetical protein